LGPVGAELPESGPLFHRPVVAGSDFPIPPGIKIGWRLDAEFWNQGLATEGAREVLRHAYEDLHLPEIVSFTSVINMPSRRVMEKIGMTRDLAGDFDHPGNAEGHPVRRHVLYRKIRRRPRQELLGREDAGKGGGLLIVFSAR
jgi:RimJ/RimL family protein N-acetyltransferase